MNRPDLDSLVPGRLYRESLGDFVVEFVGTAFMPELDGEDVAVFRYMDQNAGALVATKHGYDNGQTFSDIDDEIDDDIDETRG
jgi:hypothetical protein